jgi:predicted short-subunit dehydrogenase-like oxidoreductase (DUF2520 family)
VIGPGRLGATLVASLGRAGIAVTGVVASPGSALDPHARPPRVSLSEGVTAVDVVWIAVPDDAIELVAHDVAAALPGPLERPVAAIHSSGLGSLDLLAPLRGLAAGILSLHPLQTFADTSPDGDVLRGVPMAVTGDTQADRDFGAWLAERLGAVPFMLADEAKPLYHLAAAVASNLFVALESEAAELLAAATGLQPAAAAHLLDPLVATTAANIATRGASQALTGPVARGDVGTVRAHLALLDEQAPRFADTYRALSLQALHLAAPRLDDDTIRTLRELFDRTEGRL